jgi:hypothetical protein
MRTAVAIAVIAAGAILALAVSARVPGINLRLAGVIVIAAGLAVLLAPPSPAADWLRRRRGLPAGQAPAPRALADPDDEAYPAYLLQDPAVLAAEVLNGIRADSWAQPSAAGPSSTGPATPGPFGTGPSGTEQASTLPEPRAPRPATRPAGRGTGPRPLRSVDLGRERGPGQHGDPGARNESRNEYG